MELNGTLKNCSSTRHCFFGCHTRAISLLVVGRSIFLFHIPRCAPDTPHVPHAPEDLLVRSNIDDLFELPAPAALRRGMNEWGLAQHGKPIDGRSFLLGEVGVRVS